MYVCDDSKAPYHMSATMSIEYLICDQGLAKKHHRAYGFEQGCISTQVFVKYRINGSKKHDIAPASNLTRGVYI